jgi:hypothetical protein
MDNLSPQIVLLDALSWALIGPYYQHTGLLDLWPMPQVTCPVIDVSWLSPGQAHIILSAHIHTPDGVDDVDALVAALLRVGCQQLTPFPLPIAIAQPVSQ